MNHRFLQLHFLTSYPASLLNRDDAGFAKRINFGGASRTRISSQCLKRHWRTSDGEEPLSDLGDLAVRSRLSFERYVIEPLVAENMPRDVAMVLCEALMAEALGQSAKAAAKAGEEGDRSLETGQITVLGQPELSYFRTVILNLAEKLGNPKTLDGLTREQKDLVKSELRDISKNLGALAKAAGLDAALFGRMVTSDYLARGDAAVHVAHAFTVHPEAAESDYFSAVDDLKKTDDSLGSGHIGNAELNSGLYYTYVAVDLPLLVSNLSGCKRGKWAEEREGRELAAKIASWIVGVAATVSPGAKRGSTAPYAYAHLVLAESGNAQPRSLANAFLEPVRFGENLVGDAYQALAAHLGDLDRMYGKSTERKGAALGPTEALGALVDPAAGIADVRAWVAERVRQGAEG